MAYYKALVAEQRVCRFSLFPRWMACRWSGACCRLRYAFAMAGRGIFFGMIGGLRRLDRCPSLWEGLGTSTNFDRLLVPSMWCSDYFIKCIEQRSDYNPRLTSVDLVFFGKRLQNDIFNVRIRYQSYNWIHRLRCQCHMLLSISRTDTSMSYSFPKFRA